ncbi:PAN domain protein [Trichostrongylus colubriformis]|uniref:PAN domain protein n=1 Tax=Trichostrongylus colubriformis TaxID=6319 RepID=A0AAN8G0F1_TRICO
MQCYFLIPNELYTESVSTKCSGAAVDRTANMVVVGFMRDTATTDSIEECIERCVGAEIALGFQCLSIMYYYDETVLNCILNDASIRTNPESVTEVNSTIVDYFGVDDCYGLPEATDGRQVRLRCSASLIP